MADSSNHINDLSEYNLEENTTMLQLYDDADPDLTWIIDAADDSSSNQCDHSDHEHLIQPSSTSESLEDMVCITESTNNSAITNHVDKVLLSQVGRNEGIKELQPILMPSMEQGVPKEETTPVRPAKTEIRESNQRMRKVNGDDTILNLFAVTVAKAVSSPQKRKAPQSNRLENIKPDVTSPSSRLGNIKPDITSPKKSTGIMETNKSAVLSTSFVPRNATGPPSPPQRQRSNNIKPEVSSPQGKKTHIASNHVMFNQKNGSTSLPDSNMSYTNQSPTKASTMATGSVVMLSSIQPPNLSQLDDGEINRQTSSNGKNGSTSFINASPNSQVAHQQILQLEIAKELDGGNNSRRFQLAIQSHVSSLTLGTTYMDFDETNIESGPGDDDDESTVGNNYSIIPDYTNDEEIAKIVHHQKKKLQSLTADDEEESIEDADDGDDSSDDDVIEIVLSGDAPLSPVPSSPDSSSPKAKVSQDIQIALSPDGKLVKVLPPALLLQKSHSWVRKRMWGQHVATPQFTEQKANKYQIDTNAVQKGHDNSQRASPANEIHFSLSPQNRLQQQQEVQVDIERNQHPSSENVGDLDIERLSFPSPHCPPPTLQQYISASKEKHDHSIFDHEGWRTRTVYFCLAFVVPFTYRAGSTLPQLFFLLELVDVYSTSLHLAGAYLTIAMTLRFVMRLLCRQSPRLAAFGGTILALLAYLILQFIENNNASMQASTEKNKVQFTLFVLSSIIIGMNEIFVSVKKIVEDNFGLFEHIEQKETLLTQCLGVQCRVIQFSTVTTYAVGGVVYEQFNMTGIACYGMLILGIQLVSLLIVFMVENKLPSMAHDLIGETKHGISSSQIHSSTDFNAYQEHIASSKAHALYNGQQDIGTSFRSLVSPELETIDEVHHTESDIDEEPTINFKVGFYDSEVSDHQLSIERSLASSSETPEHDNRTSFILRKEGKLVNDESTEQKDSTGQGQANKKVKPSPNWDVIFVLFCTLLQPVLNGLIFGAGTLLLYQEYDQEKSAIGYIYGASSFCNAMANVIHWKLSEDQYIGRFQQHGKYYLVGITYMVLLTAFFLLSTYITGVLLMSLLLGIFLKSLNEVQCQHIQTNAECYKRLQPYHQWGTFCCCLLVTLMTPILYNIKTVLPNMIGTGIGCIFTVIVWFESTKQMQSTKNKGEDYVVDNRVNTTAETYPSLGSINVLALAQEELDRRKERLVTSTLMQGIYLDSLIERPF